MRAALLVLSAAATLASVEPTAVTVVVVQVGDAATGAFIEGAEVRLSSVARPARTRWDGEASFAGLAAGKYHIQVRALGYAPGDVDLQVSGDTLPVHFNLERAAAVTDTVRVVASRLERNLREFEERRSTGMGYFLTDSTLNEHRQRGLQALLATQLPGLRTYNDVVVSGGGIGNVWGNDCSVLFFLDGFPYGETLPRSDAFAREPVNLRAIRVEELAAVEMYSRTNTPQQYRPVGNYCRVVLLWTRR